MKHADQDISRRYQAEESERAAALERAKVGVQLTKPQLLPDPEHQPDDELHEPYTSVGANGLTSISSKMMLSIFPPDIPWMALDLPPVVKHDTNIADDVKQLLLQELFLTEVTAVATLEASRMTRRRGQQIYNFRVQQYKTIQQSIGTGDALQKLTPDYRIRVFGRNSYVTRRDGAGSVLYHITKERIDPVNFDQSRLNAVDLDQNKLLEMPADERLMDLFTLVEWHPVAKTWVFRQELNNLILPTEKGEEEVQDDLSPYFSIPFDMVEGDNYGRGLPELNLGDLRSLNELEYRLLSLLGLASTGRPAIDEGSNVTNDDLTNSPGTPLRCRVEGGKVQDIGWFGWAEVSEYQMLTNGIDRKSQQLGKNFQNDSAALPEGDRVTRAQIVRLGNELDSALGGLYTFLSEGLQIPLAHRVLHQLRSDGLIPQLTEEHYDVVTNTGLAALANQQAFERTMSFVQVLGQLGPGALRRLDEGVLINAIARQSRITEPGLVKSEERVQREDQQRAQAQLQQQAGEKAVDVIGSIAEQQATAQQQAQGAT